MKPEELQAIREEISAIKKDGVIMKWSMDWDSACTDREKALGDKYMGTVMNLAGKLDDALTEIERCYTVINKLKQDIYQHEFWAEKSVNERERLRSALAWCETRAVQANCMEVVAIARQALEGDK